MKTKGLATVLKAKDFENSVSFFACSAFRLFPLNFKYRQRRISKLPLATYLYCALNQ